jgi:hypothetical protein
MGQMFLGEDCATRRIGMAQYCYGCNVAMREQWLCPQCFGRYHYLFSATPSLGDQPPRTSPTAPRHPLPPFDGDLAVLPEI